VRKGRHVVPRPAELRADIAAAETAVERFVREMREGIQFLRGRRSLVFLGISWALFLAAMMTGVVVTPPLSDKVFHAGAVGYGWLNAGWGTGAFVSALYAPWFIAELGARRSIAISMGLLTISMILAPLSPMLAVAVLIYAAMGSARGVSGVAMNTSIMEQVPQHFMGRVQNTFYFAGTALQICLALLVGAVAQVSLVAGFSIIGLVYAVAFVSASWPVEAAAPVEVSTAK
jgi:MFS family permease